MQFLRAFIDRTLHLAALRPERSVLLGSGADCDLRLDLDGVPARAAMIRHVQGFFRIIPLSDVALRVNGRPVTSLAGAALPRGAHITLAGATVVVYATPGANALRTRRARLTLATPHGVLVATGVSPATGKDPSSGIELEDDDLVEVDAGACALLS